MITSGAAEEHLFYVWMGLAAAGGKELSGAVAFDLYATYGFPVDLISVIGEEDGFAAGLGASAAGLGVFAAGHSLGEAWNATGEGSTAQAPGTAATECTSATEPAASPSSNTGPHERRESPT